MKNLKAKFVKEIEHEIQATKQHIETLNAQLFNLPKVIKDCEKQIDNLQGLLKTVESDEHFTEPTFHYEDENEWN